MNKQQFVPSKRAEMGSVPRAGKVATTGNCQDDQNMVQVTTW